MKYLLFLALLIVSLSSAIYIDSLKVTYNNEVTFANISFFLVNDANSYKHVCINVEGSWFINSKSFQLEPNKQAFVSVDISGNPYSEIDENINITIIDNCGNNEIKYKLIYPIKLNKTNVEEPLIKSKKKNKPQIIIDYIDKPKQNIDNLISFLVSFILFGFLLLFIYTKTMRDHHGV